MSEVIELDCDDVATNNEEIPNECALKENNTETASTSTGEQTESKANINPKLDLVVAKTSELDKFKRRLIRAIARSLLVEKKPEHEFWKELNKETACDCKLLWTRMKAVAMKKLNRLFMANDKVRCITKIAQLNTTDWLLVDLVLVHEKIDVIGQEDQDGKIVKKKPRPLDILYNLVVRFQIERVEGDQLVKSWYHLAKIYNRCGRCCSIMLLQRRWYQLKELAWYNFYNFWFSYRGDPRKVANASIYKPSKLQREIIKQYSYIVTDHFPTWEELIQQKKVALLEDFEQYERTLSQAERGVTENQPDLIVVEPNVETVDLIVESGAEESDGECDKKDTDNEPSSCPKVDFSIVKNESQCTISDDDDVSILESVHIPLGSSTCNNEVNETNDSVKNESNENGADDDVPVICDDNEVVSENEVKIENDDAVTNVTLAGSPNTTSVSDLGMVLQKLTNVTSTAEPIRKVENDTSDVMNSVLEGVVENISQKKNDNMPIPDPQEQETSTSLRFAIEAESSKTHNAYEKPNMNILYDVTSNIGVFMNGLELEDDGIEYIEEDEDDNTTANERKIKMKAYELQGDDSPKIDFKLLLDSVVYTTRLDDMDVFRVIDYRYVNDDRILKTALLESLPVDKKSVNMEVNSEVCEKTYNTGTPDNESLDDCQNRVRINYKSWCFCKPKNVTYNPIQLCKNPDFNTRLKRLTARFLSYERNRRLLKQCKPMTIDLNKSFEKKLENNSLLLYGYPSRVIESDDIANFQKTINSHNVSNDSKQNTFIQPFVSQSLFRDHITKADVTEINKITYQIPNIDQICRVNEKFLIAEITPIQACNLNNKPPVELIDTRFNTNITNYLYDKHFEAQHAKPVALNDETQPVRTKVFQVGNMRDTHKMSLIKNNISDVQKILIKNEVSDVQGVLIARDVSDKQKASSIKSNVSDVQTVSQVENDVSDKQKQPLLKNNVSDAHTVSLIENDVRYGQKQPLIKNNVSDAQTVSLIKNNVSDVQTLSLIENDVNDIQKLTLMKSNVSDKQTDSIKPDQPQSSLKHIRRRRKSRTKSIGVYFQKGMPTDRLLALDTVKKILSVCDDNVNLQNTNKEDHFTPIYKQYSALPYKSTLAENTSSAVNEQVPNSKHTKKRKTLFKDKTIDLTEKSAVNTTKTNSEKDESVNYQTVKPRKTKEVKRNKDIPNKTGPVYCCWAREEIASLKKKAPRLLSPHTCPLSSCQCCCLKYLQPKSKVLKSSLKSSSHKKSKCTAVSKTSIASSSNYSNSPFQDIPLYNFTNTSSVASLENMFNDNDTKVKFKVNVLSSEGPTYFQSSNKLLSTSQLTQTLGPEIKACLMNSMSIELGTPNPIRLGKNYILLCSRESKDKIGNHNPPEVVMTNQEFFPDGVQITVGENNEVTVAVNPGANSVPYQLSTLSEKVTSVQEHIKLNQVSNFITTENTIPITDDISSNTPQTKETHASNIIDMVKAVDQLTELDQSFPVKSTFETVSTVAAETTENVIMTDQNVNLIYTKVSTPEFGLNVEEMPRKDESPSSKKKSTNNENNSEKKTILTDLMEMSGISVEDTLLENAGLENTGNDKQVSVPQNNINPIVNQISALNPELNVIYSFIELKTAFQNNKQFYKMDVETCKILPINVMLRKHKKIKCKRMVPKTVIDLTTMDDFDDELHKTSDSGCTADDTQEVVKPMKLFQAFHTTQSSKSILPKSVGSDNKNLLKKRKRLVLGIFEDKNKQVIDENKSAKDCQENNKAIDCAANLEDSSNNIPKSDSDDEPLAFKAKRKKHDIVSDVSADKSQDSQIPNKNLILNKDTTINKPDERIIVTIPSLEPVAFNYSSDEDCILGV